MIEYTNLQQPEKPVLVATPNGLVFDQNTYHDFAKGQYACFVNRFELSKDVINL